MESTFLIKQGFNLKSDGERLFISPIDLVDEKIATYITENKAALIQQVARYRVWFIEFDGRNFSMIGRPKNYSEALAIVTNKWATAKITPNKISIEKPNIKID